MGVIQLAQVQSRSLAHATLGERFKRAVARDWQLWVLLLPALAFFIVFCYFPM